jgi:hypothetical protein
MKSKTNGFRRCHRSVIGLGSAVIGGIGEDRDGTGGSFCEIVLFDIDIVRALAGRGLGEHALRILPEPEHLEPTRRQAKAAATI